MIFSSPITVNLSSLTSVCFLECADAPELIARLFQGMPQLLKAQIDYKPTDLKTYSDQATIFNSLPLSVVEFNGFPDCVLECESAVERLSQLHLQSLTNTAVYELDGLETKLSSPFENLLDIWLPSLTQYVVTDTGYLLNYLIHQPVGYSCQLRELDLWDSPYGSIELLTFDTNQCKQWMRCLPHLTTIRHLYVYPYLDATRSEKYLDINNKNGPNLFNHMSHCWPRLKHITIQLEYTQLLLHFLNVFLPTLHTLTLNSRYHNTQSNCIFTSSTPSQKKQFTSLLSQQSPLQLLHCPHSFIPTWLSDLFKSCKNICFVTT